MEKYLGIKVVEAEPMRLEEFEEDIRIMDYDGEVKEGYKVVYPDGYISWSPKDVFEKAYFDVRQITADEVVDVIEEKL